VLGANSQEKSATLKVSVDTRKKLYKMDRSVQAGEESKSLWREKQIARRDPNYSHEEPDQFLKGIR